MPRTQLARNLAALLATASVTGMPANAADISIPGDPDPGLPAVPPSLPAPDAAAEGPSAELVGQGPPTAGGGSTPSQNAMVNLLNLLVAKGTLKKEEAAGLIQQAEHDAAMAQAAAEAANQDALEATDGTVRVGYIPESVKAQIRDEIKGEVMAQARQEGWAAPRIVPDWVSRWTPGGDFRLRYEFLSYPTYNDASGSFPIFNSINTGQPYDVSGINFAPQYNTQEDRSRARIRLRFSEEVDLGEGWTGGFRLATGENNSPITTNQSLGLANQGQGGNFSKYAVWIDRAFLKGEWTNGTADLGIFFGRFENPFMCTETIFDEDVGMDGIAFKGKFALNKQIHPWLTAGAFPVFNTDLNFSTNQPVKFQSHDKALFAVQGGLDLKFNKDWNAKVGTAYYYFHNVEGELSDPYIPLSASDAGNTDNTRPSFAQKGNTYRPLRNIIPSPLNNYGTTNQYQYYGLATPFEIVSFTGKLDYNGFEPYQLSLTGEYLKNLAFDAQKMEEYAVNNRSSNAADGTLGLFDGSDTAWHVGVKFGMPALEKRGDWYATAGYRYVGSDAVIDGFNDSEFGGGGTNVEGYFLGGNIALSKRVWLGFRWMSANEIAGPPFKTDLFFIDIGARF